MADTLEGRAAAMLADYWNTKGLTYPDLERIAAEFVKSEIRSELALVAEKVKRMKNDEPDAEDQRAYNEAIDAVLALLASCVPAVGDGEEG